MTRLLGPVCHCAVTSNSSTPTFGTFRALATAQVGSSFVILLLMLLLTPAPLTSPSGGFQLADNANRSSRIVDAYSIERLARCLTRR